MIIAMARGFLSNGHALIVFGFVLLNGCVRSLQHQRRARVRCMVCLVPYADNTEPTVSVKCWHVHCKSCWLQTLGV